MIYRNPRLKHVKKIIEICESRHEWKYDIDIEKILISCNLLLETKKKKCEHKPNSFIPVLDVKKPVCLNCGRKLGEFEYHECKHSPQPEIEKLDDDLNYSAFRNSKIMSHNTPYVLNQHAKKINLLIDQVNKLTKTIRQHEHKNL